MISLSGMKPETTPSHLADPGAQTWDILAYVIGAFKQTPNSFSLMCVCQIAPWIRAKV